MYAKQRILETIGNHAPEGRHLLDIADDIKKHRDTARKLCHNLARDGYTTRQNKQAPYHLTDKAYGESIDTAVLFQGEHWKTFVVGNGFLLQTSFVIETIAETFWKVPKEGQALAIN